MSEVPDRSVAIVTPCYPVPERVFASSFVQAMVEAPGPLRPAFYSVTQSGAG
ncbi:hypothetical protein [Actinomadura sp. 9N407]|uniref:hypothetical protein n=1 Tax=Actinomadura sp. 9N407 TaxID=3375154 RepID=UPI0037BD77E5